MQLSNNEKPYKLRRHYAVTTCTNIPLSIVRVNPSSKGSVGKIPCMSSFLDFNCLVLCEDCLATSVF